MRGSGLVEEQKLARQSNERPADRATPEQGAPVPSRGEPAGPEVLDLRGLPPPEPLARALAAVEALPPGGGLVLLTPLMPVPLLHRLSALGYEVGAEAMPDGTARIDVRA
jgi:hypothetical protein